MDIKGVMEEAFERGEKFKEQFLIEVMNSNAINALLQNELFLKSLSKVINAKYEFQRSLKSNLKSILKTFDLPNRDEVKSVERKLGRLEDEIDTLHRRVLASKLKSKATAKKKSKKKTTRKKKTSARRKKATRKKR